MENKILDFKALVLDTETHALEGLPIEIAYTPCDIEKSVLQVDESKNYDQFFSIGDKKITLGSMAVHHILDSDIQDKPLYTNFELPEGVEYIVGHNISYDITAINKCNIDTSNIKSICTLALARHVWPDLETHNLSALIYHIIGANESAKSLLRNSHSAITDVKNTTYLLSRLIEELKVGSIEELFELSEIHRVWKKIYFGKHKGDLISSLPKSYVDWLLKKDNLDPYLVKGIYTYHNSFNK